MSEVIKTIGARFAEERLRLGLGVQELADLCGVTRQLISRLERDGNAPGGDLLVAFAGVGADPGYLLLGRRSGLIDLQLLGLAEAELRAAYGRLRPAIKTVPPIRSRISATIYNQAMTGLKPTIDVAALLAAAADLLMQSMDDPAAPGLLETNLFATQTVEVPTAGINVSGSGNRVVGRDVIVGGIPPSKA
ncbi:MAG: helix-turn-helix transcriptional regulator [Lysobacteraceae bacterium]